MSGDPIHVFLVEDNPGDALLVERYLARSSLEVFSLERAERLSEALDRLGDSKIDVVLLDLTLPDSDGIETFRRVLARAMDLPVIVMTGLNDKQLAIQAVREGAQDFLNKAELEGDGLVRSIRYAIERKRAQEALRESQERYALAVDGANDGVWDWDVRTNKAFFSPRWLEILDCEDEAIGERIEDWFDRIHPEDLDRLRRDVSSHLMAKTSHLENEHRLRTGGDDYRWVLARGVAVRDDKGSAYRLAGSLTDIHNRKIAEQQLRHDAMHDPLTGLSNSALLMDRLAIALAQANRRSDYRFALLFLDLDRFKFFNDTLGHAMGDQLLVGVSLRLQTLLRPGDTVARLGGDEFAILAHGIEDPSHASRIAGRIQEGLRRPFDLQGNEFTTTASIGISLSTTGYDRPEDLLRDADTAMYRAKAQGKGRHAIFDEEMNQRAIDLMELEAELRRGLEADEFDLHYQPIISLANGRLEGLEALVRWNHPRKGLVYPGDFIDVAEETGVIIPLGWSLLRKACGQMVMWRRQIESAGAIALSVNLSPRQFRQTDLVERIGVILAESGFEPSSLRLEITEGPLMADPRASVRKFEALRRLGVHLYIDDFGTGFSSLQYLHELPIQAVKIDRSFVAKVNSGNGQGEVVASIVTLAHNLGIEVAAEGLETSDQLQCLRKLRCEYAQGYYFSRPLDSDHTRQLLASRRHWV